MILLLPFMMQFESFACCMTLDIFFLLVFPTGSYGITLVIDRLNAACLHCLVLCYLKLFCQIYLVQTLVDKRCVMGKLHNTYVVLHIAIHSLSVVT